MKVREVMKPEVLAISPNNTYEDASRLMLHHKISGLPVVDDNRKVVGIISEKDLFRALYPSYAEFLSNPTSYHHREEQENEIESLRYTSISQIMTKNVVCIEPGAPVMRAGGIMLARGIHRLPVVERGKLVGLVTRREIYGAILEKGLGVSEGLRIEAIKECGDSPHTHKETWR